MKDKSGMMGGIYRICEWVMRFALINLIWVVLNTPIIVIVLSLLFIKQEGVFVFLLVPLFIFLPVLFFPSTTAMFASARDWVIRDEDTSTRQYLRYFKDNYKKSFIGGLVLTVFWTIWAVDYYYFSMENIIIMAIFLIMGIVLFVFTINFFSILAHYHLNLLAVFKNSFIITIGSPKLFLTILISSSIILFFSLTSFKFLIPFFTGSLLAYISFSSFYQFFLKITSD